MKIKLLSLLLLTALFMGCSKLTDENTAMLVGKWKTTEGYEITSVSGIYTTSYNLFYEFTSDGVFDFKMRDSSCPCTGACEGVCTDYAKIYEYDYNSQGTYQLKGDDISVTTDEYWLDGEIGTLNSTTLVIKYTNVYEQECYQYFTRQ